MVGFEGAEKVGKYTNESVSTPDSCRNNFENSNLLNTLLGMEFESMET
jgi:hypothetical protein